jgi:hypothetical protein
MTEKTYSAKDLSGREVDIDRAFSESEVDMFSDLFSDFWEENGDNYSDLGSMDAIDIAYSEFFDAYSCGEYSDKNIKLGKNTGRGIAAVGGAIAGYGASSILNKKDKQKRKDILLKMKQGRASSAEINELKSLKSKINTRKALSTAGGAALATAGTVGISKLKQNKIKKEMESTYSQEDLFADEFANYFVTNVDHYGDTDEGMDEAYNDFVKSKEENTEENTEEVYSEEDQLLMDNFSNFYNDVADLYSNDDQGMEDAFNDFLEIEASMDNYTEDAEIVEEEYSEQEIAFIDYYTSNEDTYGDNAELAYNDFMEVYSEVENEFENETNYSAEENTETVEEVEETQYSEEVQELASDFADFYSELEDVYGDDLEMAFDDYTDALENLANEDVYAEEVETETEDTYAESQYPKGDNYSLSSHLKKGISKDAKAGMKGAGMGAAAGLAMGAMMDPKAKERKALKAKVKAGTATDADKAKLADMKKSRRNKLMKATAGGAVAGGVLGVASKTKQGEKVMAKAGEMGKKVADTKAGKAVSGTAGKVAGATKGAMDKVKGMVSKDKNKSEQDTVETKSMDRSYASNIVFGTNEVSGNKTVETEKNFSEKDNKNETQSYVLGLIK